MCTMCVWTSVYGQLCDWAFSSTFTWVPGIKHTSQVSQQVPLPTKPFCPPSTLISETKFLAGPGLHQFGWIGWLVRPCPCLCLPSAGLIATCHHTWPFSVFWGLNSCQVLSWLSHLFHTQNSSYLFIISLTVSVPIEYYLRKEKVSLLIHVYSYVCVSVCEGVCMPSWARRNQRIT